MSGGVTFRFDPFTLLHQFQLFSHITTADRAHVSHDEHGNEVIEIRGIGPLRWMLG